ncbi:putative bifunctional diguanylate cyclase/phosphodiesterase [Deinococcus altitudinis]|uniref:putative bifunctional diguanylate cyclase/phosphodiesterase n=1 Tax=Deinococcus altitudinis TaxID=468914 RepID=UPI0038911DC9
MIDRKPFVQESIRREVERQAEKRLLPNLWQEWLPDNLIHELGVYHVELELQNAELQSAVTELEVERQHYRTLYHHAPIAYFTLDAQGVVLSVNQAGLKMLDVERHHLIMRRFAVFITPGQRALFSRLLADLFSVQSDNTHHFVLERQGGERLEVQLQVLTLPNSGHPPGEHPPAGQQATELLMTLMDITPLSQAHARLEDLNATLEDRIQQGTQQLRELNARFRHQALHDHLTGLPNRAAFAEGLQAALDTLKSNSRPFAVLFCDLDRFKLINDTLGHMAGDQVLVELSRRLQTVTRPSDLVARLGGDEFAMLLHDVSDLQVVLNVVARLESAVQQPVVLREQELTLMISTGVLMVTEHYEVAEQILRDVDLALYRAKRTGRASATVFEPAMRSEFQGRLELEAELRRALEHGELAVEYQPIVSLKDGQALGLEALVRWNHPQRGLLLPQDFLELAEELELTGQIDRQVLAEAQRRMHVWQTNAGAPRRLWMNINVSAGSLKHVQQVTEQLLHQAVPTPWQVLIEVTERVLIRGAESDPQTLQTLREAGVELVVDDFGVGYSSLSSLHRFPVRMLKIDQSFVAALDENTELIRAIRAMGQALGLVVVAEGVETEDQRRRLGEVGIEVAQGRLFSPPLPADRVEQYLRQHGGSD